MASVSAGTLREMLASFFDGGEQWRSMAEWTAYAPKASNGAGVSSQWRRWLPFLPLLIPVALLADSLFNFGYVAEVAGFLDPMSIPMPAMLDSVPARMFLIFFVLIVLLFLIALIVKQVEVQRASRWPSATGKIVKSQPGIITRPDIDSGAPIDHRIADIAYEFTVATRVCRGSRINLAERIDPTMIPGLLAQYPVGKMVKVYYDRANPSNCVLDRQAPENLFGGCLLLLAYGVGGLLIAMWVFTHGGDFIKKVLPGSNPVIMIIPLLVGLGFLAGFIAVRSQLVKARRFPRANGMVIDTENLTFQDRDPENSRIYHTPKVAYRYEVGGTSYVNRRVSYGTDESGTARFARRTLALYPVGSRVSVIYNPSDPQDAGLVLKTGWTWFLLAAALVALGFAFAFSGIPFDTGTMSSGR
jgi:Protein of unknown function (DUF3592)